MIMERHPIPAAQLRAAYCLAIAHGHEWAHLLQDEIERPEGWTAEEIRARVRDGRSSYSLPGIEAPYISADDGTIRHSTATRRLTWVVERDGQVHLWVSRPTGHVLVAEVNQAADSYVVRRINPSIPIYGRHVAAMEEALEALGWEGGPISKAFELDYMVEATLDEVVAYAQWLRKQGYARIAVVPTIRYLRPGDTLPPGALLYDLVHPAMGEDWPFPPDDTIKVLMDHLAGAEKQGMD